MKKLLTLALLGTMAAAPAFAAGMQHSQQQGMSDQRQSGMSGQQQSMNQAPGQALDENMVRRIQQQLSQQGYDVQADGIFGPNTRQALRDFQSQQGLNSTGQADMRTLSALGVTQQGQQQPQQAQTPQEQEQDQGMGQQSPQRSDMQSGQGMESQGSDMSR